MQFLRVRQEGGLESWRVNREEQEGERWKERTRKSKRGGVAVEAVESRVAIIYGASCKVRKITLARQPCRDNATVLYAARVDAYIARSLRADWLSRMFTSVQLG